MKLGKLFVFLVAVLFSTISFSSVLTSNEKSALATKLSALPITRNFIWSILFPANNRPKLEINFQNELESLLKVSLLEADTQVINLTPQLRNVLNLDNTIAAFHKQGSMTFTIVPSRAGSFLQDKKNDTVRKLINPQYFTHAHNVFVADAEISSNVNTVILLFHELSHAAFDEALSRNSGNLRSKLNSLVSAASISQLMKINKGKLSIDGDLYDLFSERYAFELEYRLDQNFSSIIPGFPRFYRFYGVSEDESVYLIDNFVRQIYNIDNPLLSNFRAYPLDNLVIFP